MAVRPFIDTLRALRYGALEEELAGKLNELVLACDKTQKAGQLTLTITVKPSRAGPVEIFDQVKATLPQFERGSTLMFPTVEGNLQREDPRQPQLPGLKTVDTTTGELKEVSANG